MTPLCSKKSDNYKSIEVRKHSEFWEGFLISMLIEKSFIEMRILNSACRRCNQHKLPIPRDRIAWRYRHLPLCFVHIMTDVVGRQNIISCKAYACQLPLLTSLGKIIWNWRLCHSWIICSYYYLLSSRCKDALPDIKAATIFCKNTIIMDCRQIKGDKVAQKPLFCATFYGKIFVIEFF